ncbi:hypothetical protein UFOVP359_136 [uncultured Caudovirales phage]|uniref:Uncharacterized protein n=1 Tax=uncultured Caudovirales phage TaxID=2100421 RepID=A0A6J7WYY4_9CAUD|nr:hypothetical protein UFOVP359_136 [uncultured Caudovirales phage]
MEFELHHEKDAGPVVRWIATKLLSFMHKIEKPLYDYADMYTAVWDDYEDEDTLAVPHNQMGIFDSLEPLPQFEKFENLTEDLI